MATWTRVAQRLEKHNHEAMLVPAVISCDGADCFHGFDLAIYPFCACNSVSAPQLSIEGVFMSEDDSRGQNAQAKCLRKFRTTPSISSWISGPG